MARQPDKNHLYLQGKQAHESGNFEIAAQIFDQLVKHEPRNALFHYALGSSLIKINRLEVAMKHLEKAAKIKPMMADIHAAMGAIEKTRLSELKAITHYERALAMSPDHPPSIYGLSDVYRKLGRFEDAVNLIVGAVERSKEVEPHLAESLAVVAKEAGREEQAIELLHAALKTDLPVTSKSALNFRLAGLLDAVGRHEEAWDVLRTASELKGAHWDPIAYERDVDEMLKFWTRERVQNAPTSGSDSEVPVFVVGMPRSGTTLVEQIIAAHPRGAGAGEINALPVAATRLQQLPRHTEMVLLRSLEKITPESLARECASYLDTASRIAAQLGGAGGATRIVDKLPYNYQLLPLIQMMFPSAHVIHTIRDPRDTCISCYFQDFLGSLGYTYSLRHLASYYAQHERIIAHMREVLDIRIMEVRYETLVAEPEPNIRSILDHIGLEFDERCLEFHKSERTVHTASVEQVRKPMYTSSKARWKRYGEKVTPLVDALMNAGVKLPGDEP